MVGRDKRTVSSLGPLLSTPVTVLESAAVSQVCVVMAAKGVDAVLLVDASGQLSGILTVGDVSRKLVAKGVEMGRTRCSTVMTPSPLSVRSTAPVSQALRQMVARRCRHLPVLAVNDGDDDVELAGILDITALVFARIAAIDRSTLQRMRITVGSVLSDPSTATPITTTSASVAEACAIMRDTRHTGILVVDSTGEQLLGILTNKDVLLRVLATGLDPAEVTVQEVLTPQPDYVTPETSVLDALQMLGDGDYLHIPVLEDGKPIGLIDVLMLTMSILDYMLKIDRDLNDVHAVESVYSEGPLWNRFWNSGQSNPSSDHLNPNEHMKEHLAIETHEHGAHEPEILEEEDAISITSAGAFYRKQRAHRQMRELELAMTGRQMSLNSGATTGNVQSPLLGGMEDAVAGGGTPAGTPSSNASFVFKVHDLDGTIHRFNAPTHSLSAFIHALQAKTGRKNVRRVLYKALDACKYELSSHADLLAAVSEARASGVQRVVVYIVGDGGEVAASSIRATPIQRASLDTGAGESSVLGWVRLNVGGVRFETVGAGLVAGSKYFATTLASRRGGAEEIKIDRDGDMFRHVLQYLRTSQLSPSTTANASLLRDLTVEADFYGIPSLTSVLQEKLKEFEEVVVVEGRDEMMQRLAKGFRVCLVEEEGKRYIMRRE
ncbi:hypothetical protein HDU78_000382 [Chytriomyces hyalinus]|nr:hypothetical protein HDU78_000382 [Chytriomyces hyalinus]